MPRAADPRDHVQVSPREAGGPGVSQVCAGGVAGAWPPHPTAGERASIET